MQTPLLFKYLPAPELGVWYLFFTVATFLALSDLGLPSAFGRAVSYVWGGHHHEAKEDVDPVAAFYCRIPLDDLYKSALLASLGMAVIISLLGFPLAYRYVMAVVGDPELGSRATEALLIFVCGVIVNLQAAIPNACLSGLGDVGWDNAARTATQVIGFVLILILLPLYPDIRTLALIYLGQGVLSFVTGHWLLVHRHRLPFLFRGHFNLSVIRRMYAESLPILVTRLGVWLVLESNLMIAGYVLGAGQVPNFAALRQVVLMGMSLPTSIPIALAPYAAAAYSAGNMEKVRYYYTNAVRYSLLVAALWTAGLLVWAPSVMDAWLGTGHFVGYPVLVPLVLACFLELHHSSHCFFVWSAGRWPFMTSSILGGLLNLILAFTGCHYYAFAGLAWGSMVAQLLTNNWYGVYYPLRLLGVAFGEYLRRTFLPTIAYLLALLVAGTGIKAVVELLLIPELPVEPSRLILLREVGVGVVVTIGVALLAAWWGMLNVAGRNELLQIFRQKRRG
jgi:O-antigen/teichoic acid export membrane protein